MRKAGTRLHVAYATRLPSECPSGNSPLCRPSAFCPRLEHETSLSACLTPKWWRVEKWSLVWLHVYFQNAFLSTYIKPKLLPAQRFVVRIQVLEQVGL